MNKAKLVDIYEGNATVRAILDTLAERTNNSKMHLVKRIQFLLKRRGIVASWREVIAAMRLLQEAGCGTFVKGSRGTSSRFYWAVKSTQAASYATDVVGRLDDEEEEEEEEDDEEEEEGDEEEIEDGEDADEYLLDPDAPSIRHSFMLRMDWKLFLHLPANLTQTEANRLAQFAESLSFTDPYVDEEDEDEGYDDDEIMHSYVLRPPYRATLRLPADLTPREATRLAEFIRVLSCTE